MDLFQFFLGVVFLIFGSIIGFKTRESNKIILSMTLIIIGLALVLGGFGIKLW